VQGTLPLALSSTDNTGIASTRVYSDGSIVATLQRGCSYDRPRPCTDEPVGSVGLPTAGLADGEHVIHLASADAAGNETRLTRPAVLRVDNRPPAAPVGLTSPAATSTDNSFSAAWSLPPDAGTPIVAARYQVCGGATCGPAQTAPSLTRVDGLALPDRGTYTLRVWLVDQLGHEAPAGAATVSLTYEPASAPAPVLAPEPTPGRPPMTTTPLLPPSVAKISPALKITAVQRVGRRVTVAGRLTSAASGRVTVSYRVRLHGKARTVVRHAGISRGRFRVTFGVTGAVAKALKAVVVVAYAGDADTSAAVRSATVRRVS
jgi:hypothetical protein